jgi:cytoskeletal protein RodZ
MTNTGILGVKTWRTQKGISLQTIAASTKLSVRQLEAIEGGDFKKLPGGIYNTNYIRQYAREIEFDEADLLAFYRDATNPVVDAPPSGKRPHPVGFRSHFSALIHAVIEPDRT